MLKNSIINDDLKVSILQPEDLIGLKIQAYKNDASRALQDKADIQKLLELKNINIEIVKKYADLFNEWAEIEKIMAGDKK